MLSRFTVGNFLSFNKAQSFSMIAGQVQKHKQRLFQADDLKLLKFSAIYGANASGKSNLVKAMAYAGSIITRGTSDSPESSYYKLDPKAKELPSYFEFEIFIEKAYLDGRYGGVPLFDSFFFPEGFEREEEQEEYR